MHLIKSSNMIMSTLVHINNQMISHAFSDIIGAKNIVMEMPLLSDPNSNTVRIRNAI